MDWYHTDVSVPSRAHCSRISHPSSSKSSRCGRIDALLAPGTRLVAVEPNLHAHDALRAQGRALRNQPRDPLLNERSRPGSPPRASTRDLHARAVHVWTTLRPALSEVRRILRQVDGSCSSNMSARPGPLRALQSDFCRRPWRFVFDGCRLDATPRPRSPRRASPTWRSSTAGSVACSCPSGPRSAGSQSHEHATTRIVRWHDRGQPPRDALDVHARDRGCRSRSRRVRRPRQLLRRRRLRRAHQRDP